SYCKSSCLLNLNFGLFLLVYRNTANFGALILYRATLLSVFASSNVIFFVASLGFSAYKIISSANRDNVISSFSVWMSFISFSFLIALARTASTLMNGIGKHGHPVFVPDVKGKAFSFSPLSVTLAVGFSYMAFVLL
uniref:Uncharacterized protein n=1 Tax=Equus caballus TaxID=9796 RepID=A0A9L0SZ33_HORSE